MTGDTTIPSMSPTMRLILEECKEQIAEEDWYEFTKRFSRFSEEQSKAFRAFHLGNNVCVTGAAGTGKSELIQLILWYLERQGASDKVIVSSFTGTAARRLPGGRTVHSSLGFTSIKGDKPEDGWKSIPAVKRNAMKARWSDVELMIIDEFSMISGVFMDQIVYAIKKLKQNTSLESGKRARMDRRPCPVNFLLAGDPFQLPPMNRNARVDGVEAPPDYIHNSKAWDDLKTTRVDLFRIFRQTDVTFKEMLTRVRFGELTREDYEKLRKRSQSKGMRGIAQEISVECVDDEEKGQFVAPLLTSLNKHVELVNIQCLDALPGNPVQFPTEFSWSPGKFTPSDPIAREKSKAWYNERLRRYRDTHSSVLELKIGAQVLLRKNIDVLGKWVNGTLALVHTIDTSDKSVVIEREDGHKLRVEYLDYMEDDIVHGVFHAKHLPITLAWACTIHMVQGGEFTKARVNLSGIFEKGQLYVALSRATSWKGLTLYNFPNIPGDNFASVDPRLRAWYDRTPGMFTKALAEKVASTGKSRKHRLVAAAEYQAKQRKTKK